MLVTESFTDIETSRGPMRTYVYAPKDAGRYPGLTLYSEIFQQTGPIRRVALMFAGHGFVVAVPEIFHELEPAGSIIPYDDAGAARGNQHKITKEIDSYDEDARRIIEYLLQHPSCSGKLGCIGICIGGHLAFRAATNPDVSATACFYATDIHKGSLGAGMSDGTLQRIPEIKGELMMIWGRQDPHIPLDGRMLIQQRLNEAGTTFTWHEFNGQHAFMRDEGARYDPELALLCYQSAITFFRRCLAI